MKRLLTSIIITLALFSTVYASQINDQQVKPNTFATQQSMTSAENAISDRYTKAESDATLAVAISAIGGANQTVSVIAGEDLTAGDVVSLINSYGTVTAKKNNLAVNTSPNGAESMFESSACTDLTAIALDTTRFIVVGYWGSRAKAIIGTVTGSTIAWGSSTAAFEAVGTSNVKACKIGTDKVLACYYDSSDTFALRMVVLTISGNVITVGSPASVVSGATTYVSMTQLDTDKALICFTNNTKGSAKIVTVSTTTPTPYPAAGSAGTDFNGAATSYISVSTLSATSAIVAYQDGGNSSYGTAQVLSISGTTITPGTEYVFNSATTYDSSIAAISTTQAVITYSAGSAGNCVVATNSSGALGYGTPATFDNGTQNTTTKIDATHVLIAYWGFTAAKGRNVIATVNGTGISISTPYNFNATGATYVSACYLGNNKSAIAYRDSGATTYGTAVINTGATTDYSAVRGLCQTTTSSGGSAPILISGSFNGLTGLSTGSQYFVGADFALTTAPVSLAIMKNSSTQTGEIFCGVAKSSTEIIIGIDYR